MLVSKYSSSCLLRLYGISSSYSTATSVTPKLWNTTTRNLTSQTSTRKQQQQAAVICPQEYSSPVVDTTINHDQINPQPLLKPCFSVEEVRIPTIGGYIAGKLWKGSQITSTNSSSLDISPIICMHGWLDNAGSFDPLLPLLLKPNMLALAIDFPGHGLSSYNSPPLHYDAHVESIIALHSILDYYNWDKFTILGHSLGAIVGFVVAGVFPELVDKFIALENVRPIPRDCIKVLRYSIEKLLELEKKKQEDALFHSQKPLWTSSSLTSSYTFDELVHRFYKGRNGTISLEACKILMRRGAVQIDDSSVATGNVQGGAGPPRYRFAHDVRAAFPTGLWRFSPSQTEEIAEAIKCPVCFIKGEPGGDYEDRSKYDQIVQLMQLNNPNPVEYHHVEGTHHFHINNPGPVVPIISKFLNLS